MLPVPSRRHDAEIMDRPDNSAADLETALADLSSINRFLGGRRVLLKTLRPYLEASTTARPFELLDVGTGGADLPIAIVEYARKLGCPVRVTALDRNAGTAAIAGKCTRSFPEIRIVCADGLSIPFASGSFDLVTASLFLHHFEHADVVRLLASFAGLARRAVVINDLRRHWLPWGFIHIVSRAARLHPMIAYDGPLSVLRGFTSGELLAAARESGAGRAEISARWPYRLAMTLDTRKTT